MLGMEKSVEEKEHAYHDFRRRYRCSFLPSPEKNSSASLVILWNSLSFVNGRIEARYCNIQSYSVYKPLTHCRLRELN